MQIRTLHVDDTARLLAFELANRAWFEQHVVARPADFFSEQGVARHIEECLANYRMGQFHPHLIQDAAGAIVGRVNLKHIDAARGTAEVGYRIGRDQIGRGLASQAVEHMKSLALTQWKLHQLDAFVTLNNHASARVMSKAGFQRGELLPQFSTVNGAVLDCYHYAFCLSAS